MKKKIVCIFVFLLFIHIIPTVICTEQPSPVGFGPFNGHIGIVLMFGRYQWFENGPPALP